MTAPYADGVLVDLLRAALPGVTVETQQAPDLESRTPYVAVNVSGGNVTLNQALVNVTATFDVWQKPSKRAAWVLSAQAINALVTAWRDQTAVADGYLKYVDLSGDIPQEIRLAGQPADLFHYSWTITIGVRPPESEG